MAANRPADVGARDFAGQLGRGQHVARGRVPRADDEQSLARISFAGSAHDVGHAVLDVSGILSFAVCPHPARAHRVGGAPGPRRIDDGAGQDAPRAVGGVGDDDERRLAAVSVLHAVVPRPADRRDAVSQSKPRCQGGELSQRLEVGLDHRIGAWDLCLVGGSTPRPIGFEQAPRGGVDQIRPRREQPNVPEAAQVGGDRGPGLQKERLEAAFEQMGGRGEADGPRADDRDGKGRNVRHDADPVRGYR